MTDSNRRGKRGEDYFRFAKGLTSDKEVERTGTGSDFKAGDHNYEVKTGSNARLSPKQREEKRRRGSKFHEVRVDDEIDY